MTPRDDLPMIDKLKAAGMVVGRVWRGPCASIDRGDARVWIDLGQTIRYMGDAETDADGKLFLDVVEISEGPAARARGKRAGTTADARVP